MAVVQWCAGMPIYDGKGMGIIIITNLCRMDRDNRHTPKFNHTPKKFLFINSFLALGETHWEGEGGGGPHIFLIYAVHQ